MNAGLEFFQQGKYAECLAKLAQVEKNVGGRPFPQVLFVKGASYFNLNDYPNAITAFEAYQTNFAEGDYINAVRMSLGRSYIGKGEPAKGIEILKALMDSTPAVKAEAALHVAESLKKQGKSDEALATLNAALTGGIRTTDEINAAKLAADLYDAKGQHDKAAQLKLRVRLALDLAR